MTISQERAVLSTSAPGRVEFATAGARRGRDCPWLVQGEIRRDGAREALYIIAEPTEPTGHGGRGAKFIAAIRDVYAASTHDDPIVALTAALEAANDALYASNRSTAPGSRLFLGLTCLLVREHDLIICQVPPTQLILAQNGTPVILPGFETWQADYQPHAAGDHQGLGATDTATPLLYRAVLEEGDLLALCSSNLARLLAAAGEAELGPLLESDPHRAAKFLQDLAERNGLDPAYGVAFVPPFASAGAPAVPAGIDHDDEAEGWDEPEQPAAPPQGERWLERSLREMRDWSDIIPWPRRGGGRIVPLRRSQERSARVPDEPATDDEPVAALAWRDYGEMAAPPLAGTSHPHDIDPADAGAAYDDEDEPAAEEPGRAHYRFDEPEDEPAPHRHRARVAGRAAPRRGGIGQAIGAAAAFVVLLVGGAIERLLPTSGRRRSERFLDGSRSRVWPLGNLERHGARGPRIGRALPLVALAALVILGVMLTVSVRNRQLRGEQQRFDAALAGVARQREAALGSSDKLAAYNRLLTLPDSLNTIPGAEKPGRPERIAAERAAIAVALDRVAGVERLASSAVQVVAPLPSTGGASTGRPQLVARNGQQFALINGTVYSIDGRTKAMTKILGKGDTFNGVSVGQVVGIVWRVDTLFAFTETHGFVKSATGWTTTPLAATGRKAAAVESFDGNLYFLEPERGQIVKFASGSYAQPPQPWSSTKSATDLGLALDFAIDTDIYTLLSDGRILDYFQGELKTSFAPSAVPPFAGASAITVAPEGRWLYLVDPKEGRIVRLGRDGNLAGIYKPAADAPAFTGARDIAVDEASGTLYLLTDAGVLGVRLP